MKKLAKTIQKLYDSELARWLFSLLAALLILGVAAMLSTISYYDNDDLNIAWALAGYRTGAPSFAHPFINCVMAAITSALYTVLPQIPWWLVLQLGACVLGMTAVFASALKTGAKNRVPLILILALMGVFGAGLFYYGIVLTTFTLSSTIAGAGAVALVLSADTADGKKTRRVYLIGAVALLAVSLLVRNSSGLAAACFTAGALIYRAMDAKISGAYAPGRQLLIFFAIAVALSSVLVGVNAYGREAQNPEGFVAYDEARSSYMDYPRDSYGENPAAYEKADWDETLAAMTDSWFYMDERVTTEAFNTIAQSSAFAAMGAGEKLSVGLSSLKTLLDNYPLAVYYGLMVAAAYLAALALFLLRRKHWMSILGASAYLLGSAVLLSYLLSLGRINLRVWMTVSILSCVAIWFCALTAYGASEEENTPSKEKAARFVLVGLMLLVSLGLSYKVFRTVVSYENETPDLLARSRAVTAYAQAHPDNVYIRDVYAANNVDALSVYPDNPPTNLMDWGGCDMNTVTRNEQLAVNGLSSTWAKDLVVAGNVYYIGDQNDRYLPLFVEYMQLHCGSTGYEVADSITGSIVAVRFLFGGGQ